MTRAVRRSATPDNDVKPDLSLLSPSQEAQDVKPFPATPQRSTQANSQAAYPTPSSPKKRTRPVHDDEDFKPQLGSVEARVKAENAGERSGGPAPEYKRPKVEEQDIKPSVVKKRAKAVKQAVEAPEEVAAPPRLPRAVIQRPSNVKGRVVVWDPRVKTILTTAAKKDYKVSQEYLDPLDRQEGTTWRGYPFFLYSESQVQEAAWQQRGGPEYFEEYIQKLHRNQYNKTMNTGKGPRMNPELGLDEYPLKVVDYYKDIDSLSDDHVDSTYVGSKPKAYVDYEGDYDCCSDW